MKLDKYPYEVSDTFLNYNFISKGPVGSVQKSVLFTQITPDDPIIYNLGFGDVSTVKNEIDDIVITNNEDKDKVLATVANTIIDFTNYYLNTYVFVKGSTQSRTRLYQMGIARHLEGVSLDFDIYGLKNLLWFEFKRNMNYSAFLVKRKY